MPMRKKIYFTWIKVITITGRNCQTKKAQVRRHTLKRDLCAEMCLISLQVTIYIKEKKKQLIKNYFQFSNYMNVLDFLDIKKLIQVLFQLKVEQDFIIKRNSICLSFFVIYLSQNAIINSILLYKVHTLGDRVCLLSVDNLKVQSYQLQKVL